MTGMGSPASFMGTYRKRFEMLHDRHATLGGSVGALSTVRIDSASRLEGRKQEAQLGVDLAGVAQGLEQLPAAAPSRIAAADDARPS